MQQKHNLFGHVQMSHLHVFTSLSFNSFNLIKRFLFLIQNYTCRFLRQVNSDRLSKFSLDVFRLFRLLHKAELLYHIVCLLLKSS